MKRIIHLAMEYGMLDASLFNRFGILTSAEIQRPYLFDTKRHKVSQPDAGYCLLSDAKPTGLQSSNSSKSSSKARNKEPEKEGTEVQYVTFIIKNVTSGTHSIA